MTPDEHCPQWERPLLPVPLRERETEAEIFLARKKTVCGGRMDNAGCYFFRKLMTTMLLDRTITQLPWACAMGLLHLL
jgi:hypothetical protein